jgi:hypothetical protein
VNINLNEKLIITIKLSHVVKKRNGLGFKLYEFLQSKEMYLFKTYRILKLFSMPTLDSEYST